EPVDPTGRIGLYYRGRGGAVLNYVETTYGGQRAVSQLIACGALDRHPGLRILVSEGGATWGPFLADRMDEGYRQHGAAVRPRLSKAPSEYLFTQVYASFQHARSAGKALEVVPGWRAPPDASVVGTPARRAVSVRRSGTSTWGGPTAPAGPLELRGRARDLYTGEAGTPVVLGEAGMVARVGGTRRG